MPTEEMLTELKLRVARADESIKTAKDELRIAERAGVNVDEQKARLNEVTAKIKRVKQAYSI